MTSEFSQIEVKNFASNFFPHPLYINILSFPLFPMGDCDPRKNFYNHNRKRQKEFSVYLSTEIEIELKYQVSESITIKF
jgi:hypothetical protein